MTETQFVAKFDYTKEFLTEQVELAQAIDRNDIEAVKEAKKQFVKFRTTIKKTGKSYRDEANAFNKSVLTKEKEYLAITEPTENELDEIIKAEEMDKVLEARRIMLPERVNQIVNLWSQIEVDADEEEKKSLEQDILAMSDEEWVAFLTRENENVQTKIQEKKEREEFEKGAEERAAAKAKADQEEKERQEAAAKAKEEQDKKDEAERMAKNEKYQEWMTTNNFDKETMILKDDGEEIKMYQLVSTYKK